MAFRIDTPENAQDVILLPSEIVPLADLIHEVANSTGGYSKAKQSLLLRATEFGLF
jgi:hypothetical protein